MRLNACLLGLAFLLHTIHLHLLGLGLDSSSSLSFMSFLTVSCLFFFSPIPAGFIPFIVLTLLLLSHSRGAWSCAHCGLVWLFPLLLRTGQFRFFYEFGSFCSYFGRSNVELENVQSRSLTAILQPVVISLLSTWSTTQSCRSKINRRQWATKMFKSISSCASLSFAVQGNQSEVNYAMGTGATVTLWPFVLNKTV